MQIASVVGFLSLSLALVAGARELGSTRLEGIPADEPRVGEAGAQTPDEALLSWEILTPADARVIRAVLRARVSVVAPPFDSVRLERVSAGTTVRCMLFPAPVLHDDGVSRSWVFQAEDPARGSCRNLEDAPFVAAGFRGDVATRSPPVR